ncbi:3-hydroxyacyl-CoA dehydrogenase, partial [Streptomyces albidoflavus]|nr:3-hydroxyacyl-CoA dehydrogenase [Streptomyces albidoflavus]
MSQHEQADSFSTPDAGGATTERFPVPSELVRAATALVRRHPRLCALRRIGVSRAGRPLHLLSVGHADAAVLVVAGAHANEPAGGPAVRRL